MKGTSKNPQRRPSKTVWLYRERLKALNLMDVLFARFHEQLAAPAPGR
jgi:hypothetical protein